VCGIQLVINPPLKGIPATLFCIKDDWIIGIEKKHNIIQLTASSVHVNCVSVTTSVYTLV